MFCSLEVAVVTVPDGTIQGVVVVGYVQECEDADQLVSCVVHQSLVLDHVDGEVGVVEPGVQ